MIDWKATMMDMRARGMKTPSMYPHISIKDSKNVLKSAFEYALSFENKKLIWVPEYDQVADWLSDNKSKGLYLYGKVGNGKSMLSRYVIPAIFLKFLEVEVHVYDMNELDTKIDETLRFKYISLDDIGTESTIVNYGKRRDAFNEILDNAEKTGKLLIVSSNLPKNSIDSHGVHIKGIAEQYGDRVFDRMEKIMRMIPFNNESFRR